MSLIQAVLSDPWVQVAASFLISGLMLSLSRLPKNPKSRKLAIGLLWAICFGVLAIWAMRQQSFVLAGGHFSSAAHPVAVPIKGTIRYVSQVLAYRHAASMWVLLFFGLGFVAAYKLARVGDEA